jgi:hypothetical protein
MRALLLVTAMLIGGCASQPASQPTPTSSPAAAVPAGDAEAHRLTADQLDKMEAQQQRELDQLNNRPNAIKGLP